MYAQKVVVLVPPLRPVPSGASILGAFAARLVGSGDSVSAAWLRWRERRAVARTERRDADDRRHLMVLARNYMKSQPEFAKDLIAAAQSQR